MTHVHVRGSSLGTSSAFAYTQHTGLASAMSDGNRQLWIKYVRKYGDEDESGYKAQSLEKGQAQCLLCGATSKGNGTR